MTRVGLSLSTSARSSDQQSPSFGRPLTPTWSGSPIKLTGATRGHHFVTPTSHFFAPTAHKIDVALGASDTIRKIPSVLFFFIRQEHFRPLAAWLQFVGLAC